MEKMKNRTTITNSLPIALPNEGVLTLAFRGSVSELGVRLLARPTPDADFFEGSSTIIETHNDTPRPHQHAFYMAMHALLTKADIHQNQTIRFDPKNIAVKNTIIKGKNFIQLSISTGSGFEVVVKLESIKPIKIN